MTTDEDVGEVTQNPTLTDLIDWEQLVEELAPLEHQQWRHWSEELADNEDLIEERVQRWQKYWVPYPELSEDVKDHDREWAEEVAMTVRQHIEERQETRQCPRCGNLVPDKHAAIIHLVEHLGDGDE